jgi:hypothetical protein
LTMAIKAPTCSSVRTAEQLVVINDHANDFLIAVRHDGATDVFMPIRHDGARDVSMHKDRSNRPVKYS